jgi:exopolysaccharide biosynthesis WecB/TagA/CpsF family protein
MKMPIDEAHATSRRNFLGIGFDPLTMTAMIDCLRSVTPDSEFRYIVTPNVDHLVRLADQQHDGVGLSSIYAGAAYCLCDSRVLSRIARHYGVILPVVPGSDLTAAVFAQVVQEGDVVAVVGARKATVNALRDLYPSVQILHHEPPMGLRDDPIALSAAAAFSVGCSARFTFLAVGSPQQEMLARQIAKHPDARGTALCIGASIDFIAGHQKRAPVLLQRMGLEWAYRLATNPLRLWRRYLVQGPRIFSLAHRWSVSRAKSG